MVKVWDGTPIPAPAAVSQQRQIFVAYSYSLYDKASYRGVFQSLEKAYSVKFIFADEKITNMHILQKIVRYIQASDFSIFDISGWNPNVTLELGIAMRNSDKWYICFNPQHTPVDEVPSDIKGIDRIQYETFETLEEKLTVLLEQQYPRETRVPLEDYLERLRGEVLNLLQKSPGMKMQEIADVLGINVKMGQIIVFPMLGKKLRVEGKTRGAKYFLL